MKTFSLVFALSALLSINAHAWERCSMSTTQALKVAKVLLDSKEITRTFNGKYSTIHMNTKLTDIILTKIGYNKISITLDAHQPELCDLEEILVDGVTVKEVLGQ